MRQKMSMKEYSYTFAYERIHDAKKPPSSINKFRFYLYIVLNFILYSKLYLDSMLSDNKPITD